MKGPETRLRKRVVKKLLEKFPGLYIRKIHGNQFQNIGIPDLLGCYRGVFFAIEMKRPGKKATPAQTLELEFVRRAGGRAGVATSYEEAEKIVEGK